MATALVGAVLAPAGAFASGLAPVAVTDTLSTDEDVVLHGNVISNDTDNEGDPLQVTSYGPINAAYGTLVIVANGNLTYTPKANWSGTVPRTWYFVNDGTTSTKGWIDITVLPVADPPTAADDTITVLEDTATNVTAAIKANDTDPDGGSLTVTAVANATGGLAVVVAGVVTFTPAADSCGAAAATFDYTASNGLTDDAHVTVDVTCVNDAPVAVDDTASGTEDTAVEIAEADLTANDTDVEDDTLAVDIVDGAVHGSVEFAAGVVTFTPADDYCGTGAAFEYTATDGTDSSDPATVAIDLECVNDAPVAVDDTATVVEGSLPANHDVLDNDTDIDGDSLTVSSPTVDPAAGTVGVASNMVRYAPAASFTGDAVITYTVSDGNLTDTGTLTVTVVEDSTAPAPVAPTVAFGTGRVNESAPLVISWSATDAGSGVKSYEVQARVGTGAWTTIYTGTGTSVTKLYGFGTNLQWQVRATDNADNVSGWAVSNVRKLAAYQGAKPVTYTGTWTNKASSGSSGTGYKYTTTAGKKVQLTFTGLGVLYVAPRISTGGYAKVTIAGVTTRVRLKSDATRLGVIVKSQLWGTSASRTIRVVNDQGGKRTTFDAFIVLQ